MSEFFCSIIKYIIQNSIIINTTIVFIMLILAIYSIIISIKNKKLKKEKDEADKTTMALVTIYNNFENVNINLDLKNLPIVQERIEVLEEKVNLLENKALANAEMYIKLGNIEYVHGNLIKAFDYFKKVLEDEK